MANGWIMLRDFKGYLRDSLVASSYEVESVSTEHKRQHPDSIFTHVPSYEQLFKEEVENSIFFQECLREQKEEA